MKGRKCTVMLSLCARQHTLFVARARETVIGDDGTTVNGSNVVAEFPPQHPRAESQAAIIVCLSTHYTHS